MSKKSTRSTKAKSAAKLPESKPVENVCSTCGRCGRKFVIDQRAKYTTLCKKCRVPHMDVGVTSTLSPPYPDEWRCSYCGQTGPLMVLRASDCSVYYPPCESCGGHPYCTPDCKEMLGALKEASQNGAHLIGFKS